MTKNVLARTLALVAACALAAPALAGGEDLTDDSGVKLKAPKGWTVTKAKDDFGGIADVTYEDGVLTGNLTRVDAEGEKTLASIADEDEAIFKDGAKAFQRTKDEKLDRKPGEWLLREFHYETGSGLTMHYVAVYAKKAPHVFMLKIASGDDMKKHEAAVKALIDALDLGGGAAASGDKPSSEKPAAASGAATGETVANPWGKWAEGSWVEFQIASEMGGAQTEMTQKQTLVAKTAEELTLKVEGKMTKPAAMDVPANEMKMPAKSPSGGAAAPAATNTKELAKGEETLDVGGKKVKCTWVETEIDAAGQKMTSKVWQSDEVPGGMVKSVTKSGAGSSTMTLVNFEAKK